MVVPPRRLRPLVRRRARHADERGHQHRDPGDPTVTRSRRPPDAPAAPSRRADRPLGSTLVHVRGEARRRPGGRLDRLGALRSRPPRVLAELQVPPAARPDVLHGQLPELPDDGRRRAERARLCRAAARRGRRPRPERARVARARPARRHRQDRRPLHSGRLLLPHDDPAAASVAGVRALPAQRRRPRQGRRARRPLAPLRHRAPAGRCARDRRRLLGPRGRSRRGGRGWQRAPRRRAGGRCGFRRLRGARPCARAGRLRRRAGARRRRHGSLPDPGRTDHRRNRCRRAAARLPGERPGRRDAAVRGPAPGRRVGDSTRHVRRRRRRGRGEPGRDGATRARRRAGEGGRRPARNEPGHTGGDGAGWPSSRR